MYKLKQIPEDFIVKEISNVFFEKEGRYNYYLLKKKNRNTIDVIKEISKQLGLKEREIGFAGIKDKHAVTEQVISIPRKFKTVDVDDVSLKYLGSGNKPISLGDLGGNKFEIVVRNLNNYFVDKVFFIENYFDEQRFSKNNKEIGKFIIKKEFSKAVELIDNFKVQEHLKTKKNDFIGALKQLPLRLLRLFVNAYQSYLWNESVAKYLEAKKVREVDYSLGKFIFVEKEEDLELPLIGFGTEGNLEIMKREGINYLDFVIKQIPELSLEGEMRKVFVPVKGLEVVEGEDELNSGKKKLLIKFSLPKGSYATMVVKRVISIR